MKKLLLLLCIASLQHAPATGDPAAALAAAKARYPGTDVRAAIETPLSGVYEFDMGGQTVYGGVNARFLILGRLIDMDNIAGSASADYASIASVAVDLQQGDSGEVVLFSDPQCPYCVELERRLLAGALDGYQIRLVLAPILEGSTQIARALLCASDPGMAYRQFMLAGHRPAGCDRDLLSDHVAAMRSAGVTATPSLLAPSGALRVGLPDANDLRDWVAAEQRRP